MRIVNVRIGVVLVLLIGSAVVLALYAFAALAPGQNIDGPAILESESRMG